MTQAAFIRSLMASYVERSLGRGVSIGGLFGEALHAGNQDVLRWNRLQQAAFLIYSWQAVSNAVGACDEEWADSLRQLPTQQELSLANEDPVLDKAFISNFSLLATDQGVRGILHITNDMCFAAADQLGLMEWDWREEIEEDLINHRDVSDALEQLEEQQVSQFLKGIAAKLCEFDWRTSSAPDLTEPERQAQMVFRGSGGYKELRRQLLRLLISSENGLISETANDVADRLRYTL